MKDPIEAALDHIQERCRYSWSENEIISLIEEVKKMVREKPKVEAPKVWPPLNERWG